MGQIKGQTGNRAGRPVGAKNKVCYNAKTILSEGLTNDFVKSIFDDIENIESPEGRAKQKLKLLEFFIPKPREQDDIDKENEFRNTFMDRMFPKA